MINKNKSKKETWQRYVLGQFRVAHTLKNAMYNGEDFYLLEEI